MSEQDLGSDRSRSPSTRFSNKKRLRNRLFLSTAERGVQQQQVLQMAKEQHRAQVHEVQETEHLRSESLPLSGDPLATSTQHVGDRELEAAAAAKRAENQKRREAIEAEFQRERAEGRARTAREIEESRATLQRLEAERAERLKEAEKATIEDQREQALAARRAEEAAAKQQRREQRENLIEQDSDTDAMDTTPLSLRTKKKTRGGSARSSRANSPNRSKRARHHADTPQNKNQDGSAMGSAMDTRPPPSPKQHFVDGDPRGQPRESRPPAVVVKTSTNYARLTELLAKNFNKDIEPRLRGPNMELMARNVEQQQKLVKVLTEANISFHTYNHRKLTNTHAVIRGLHPEITNLEIREDLTARGFTVMEVHRFGRGVTAFPVVAVSVVSTPGAAADLFKVTRLCSMVVTVEKKTRSTVTACLKCSKYGHTANYCSPALEDLCCGLCGGQHSYKQHPEDIPICCPKCGGDHAVTYGDCPEGQEWQQRRARRRGGGAAPENTRTGGSFKEAPKPNKNTWEERAARAKTGGKRADGATPAGTKDQTTTGNEDSESALGGLGSCIAGFVEFIKSIKEFLPEIMKAVKQLMSLWPVIQGLIKTVTSAFAPSSSR